MAAAKIKFAFLINTIKYVHKVTNKCRNFANFAECFENYYDLPDEELQTTSLDGLMPWYYEPCGVNGQYIRVSIRAIKENLITEDVLLDAFTRSANSDMRPTVEFWRDRWHRAFSEQKVWRYEKCSLNMKHSK